MNKLFVEAFIVGIGLVIVGMTIHLFIKRIKEHDMNDNVTLAIHFFIAGFIVHLLCEYSNINKWYCKNGNACN